MACGSVKQWASALVPARLWAWVHYRKTQVATWELVAALCALWNVLRCSNMWHGHALQVNMFIDSTVALGTLLRGSSRQSDWNVLISDLWFQIARTGTLLLAWRVPSRQNIADIPTRPAARQQDLKRLVDLGFAEVTWIWPESAPWMRR